jgi:hypothetical protein
MFAGRGTDCYELSSSELPIEALVRDAMLQVARLATAGGTRASLSRVGDQVFLELTSELERQGVTKHVIADMFGMALRTYHRRVQQVRQEQAERQTVWEGVLELVRASGPISAHAVHQHFLRHPSELVSGALNDLVHSGLASRSGWGDKAVYRGAAATALRRGEPIRHVRVASERR